MNYDVSVLTITPLHIGTGDVLLRDYDYVTGANATFVLDRDAVLAAEYERTGQVPTKPPGALVAATELRESSPLVRYVMAGKTTVDQVRAQVQDVRGQLYIPGSSLKGALRTVLFAHAVASGAFTPDTSQLEGDKVRAGQPWERRAFGDSPNTDLLRALRVADSRPLAINAKRLLLLHAQVFQAGKSAAPIWVQAIAQRVQFHTTLQLDEFLLKAEQVQKLGWGVKAKWLQQLPQLAQARAQARIAEERAFAQDNGWTRVVKVYDELRAFKPKPEQFLLQMGWGTGYSGMTIGMQLAPADRIRVRERYRLGRPPQAGGDWRVSPEQTFPKSRRLRVASGTNADAEPDRPLGWVLVELKAR